MAAIFDNEEVINLRHLLERRATDLRAAKAEIDRLNFLLETERRRSAISGDDRRVHTTAKVTEDCHSGRR